MFAIALGFAAFEGKYLIFGIATSLPFIGIAAYSAYKQAQRPTLKRVLEVDQAANTGIEPLNILMEQKNYLRAR